MSAYGANYFQHSCGPPYERSEPHWSLFFGRVAGEIVTRLAPRRVLDAGCAKGFLVEALRDRGVEAFGFDLSEYAIGEVREDIRPYCWVADITQPLNERYDLITCIEVLEHVPEPSGLAAIRNLAAHTDAILFSSTPNDFTEPTHVNVRPCRWWLEVFREAGFAPDPSFDAGFIAPQAMLLRKATTVLSDEWLDLFARNRELTVELDRARNDCDNAASHQERAQDGQDTFDLKMLRAELENARAALTERERELEEQRIAYGQIDRDLHQLQHDLQIAREELQVSSEHLTRITSSFGWRLISTARVLRDRIFPAGTRHRRYADLVLHAIKYASIYGAGALFRRMSGRARNHGITAKDYQRWIALKEPKAADFEGMRAEAATFAYRPLISIVTPVYNSNLDELRACIESVRSQVYDNWELCLYDDASKKHGVQELLEGYGAIDARIKVKLADGNHGIAVASNAAIALASGEFVGLLDHDDELAPHALFEVVRLLQERRDADVIYSDEDKLDRHGVRCEPFFKPDWSPELLQSFMYTCHFSVFRKSLLDQLGGFRRGFEGSQDYDLMLRAGEATSRILHIPRLLYHWRKSAESAAGSSMAKPYATAAARRALTESLERRGVVGRVVDGPWPTFYRVQYAVVPERVSIIIPTRDNLKVLRKCVESIERKTKYPDYEIIVVDNNSSEPETLRYLERLPHKVVPFPEPFNFSRIINCGARHATGRYLLLLNNDTEVIARDWLSALVEFGHQEAIGIVGARLLYPNRTIQHAGVTLGICGGVAGHSLLQLPADSPYYFGFAGVIRNCSAVTAACMLVRHDIFDRVNGFDESMPVAFNDVDFCLRVLRAGYRIVYQPHALLYHHESKTRGYGIDPADIQRMKDRWGASLLQDPYYNPNLTLDATDYSLRF